MFGFLGMLAAGVLSALPSLYMGMRSAEREEKRYKEEKARLAGDYQREAGERSRRAKEDITSLFSTASTNLAAGGMRDPYAGYRKQTAETSALANIQSTLSGQLAGLGYGSSGKKR